MRFSFPFVTCVCALAFFTSVKLVRADNVAHGSHGAVASVHPLASQAGMDVLENGGNAIDAAVAVALTLGVVDGHDSGIGGGCFILIRRANGEIVAIDGREKAPAAASRDMFIRDGHADPQLSETGALAIGVPGALAAYAYAAEHFGKMPLAELLEPAARIAENGFPIDRIYAARIAATAENLRRFDGTNRLFFDADGSPLTEGATLRQPDLAESYREIARAGIDWFYGGPFASRVAEWMRANGGLLTADDFAKYRVELREPVRGMYRGAEIVSFPPPSSGGAHVQEILNILETFDLRALAESARVHVMAESMKLAFADRAFWLGDPDFAPVPRGLLDKGYAHGLAERIKLDGVIDVPGHGEPPNAATDIFRKHTTHFSVADAEGNWVACTATINTSFGSKIIVPGSGILLNNEMDDFSAQPGVPNHFGLVGGEANAIAPGKRPLSSMSPTIVLRDGKPILAVGAAGGPSIITQTVLAITGMIDLGLTLEGALAQPRFHHQWLPDELRLENRAPAPLRDQLTALGHHVEGSSGIGASNAVSWSAGEFTAASDPRVPGEALAW